VRAPALRNQRADLLPLAAISALHSTDIRVPAQAVSQEETALRPPCQVNTANASIRCISITMSITDDAPEAAWEDHTARSSMFTTIKNYFITVGLPTSSLLTQHAAERHHEDVPNEVAKEGEGTAPFRSDPLHLSPPFPSSLWST
jgi:hypothetical protein